MSGSAVIGGSYGGTGVVELASQTNQPMSTWGAASIDIGNNGTGTLDIGPQTYVETGAMRIGQGIGTAVFVVHDGGTVLSGRSVIGGHSARVTLGNEVSSGRGSQWILNSDLDIGDAGGIAPGSALLRILADGNLGASGRIRVHAGGKIMLDGGSLQASSLALDSGDSFEWRKGLVYTGSVTLGGSVWTPSLMVLSPGQTLQSGHADVNTGMLVINGGALVANRLTLGGGMVVNAAGFGGTGQGSLHRAACSPWGTPTARARSSSLVPRVSPPAAGCSSCRPTAGRWVAPRRSRPAACCSP